MRFIAAVFLVLASYFPLAASAAEPVDVELLNGGYSGQDGPVLMGLKVRLEPGWHTYWKTAGEGGFAPEIDTSASDNLRGFDIHWPAPERIAAPFVDQESYETNGYTDEVVLPLIVNVTDRSKAASLRMSLRIFACQTVCSAFERKLEAVIAPNYVSATAQKEIAGWLRRVPKQTVAGLSLSPPEAVDGGFRVNVATSGEVSGVTLHVSNPENTPYRLETDPMNTNGDILFTVRPEGGTFGKAAEVELVAVSGDRAVTLMATPPAPETAMGLELLVTAFLGGLILNLMPCVFPVLSLKLMSMTRGNVREARIGFAGSSIGIVASFIFLGGVLAMMKMAGAEIGWGIQFQSAGFLLVMGAVVMVFAAATSGIFEISLPGSLATTITRLTNGKGMASSIGQGFVATLLATPCSAPFVGTAVGFALAGSAGETVAMFAAMGFGMALPYLAIAALPGLGRLMPRPGVWMDRVRQLISLSLFATAGWLFTSLWAVSPIVFFAIALPLSAALIAVAAVGRRKWLPLAAAVVFCIPILVDTLPADRSGEVAWLDFNEASIARNVEDGKTVVVNMTAKWCLTCKVNDRTTWNDTTVVKTLEDRTVAMRGDWTKPDPAISAFLKKHGRFGIPFTVVYSPRSPEGVVLPEILSPSTVTEAIDALQVAGQGL